MMCPKGLLVLTIFVGYLLAFAKPSITAAEPAADEADVADAERHLAEFDAQIADNLKGLSPAKRLAGLRETRADYYKKVEPGLLKHLMSSQTALRSLVGKKGMTAPDVQAARNAVDRLQQLLMCVNSVGMKLIVIEPGAFTMGAPATEAGYSPHESPHKVILTRRFRMAVTHVTRGQFTAFVGDSDYKTDAERAGMGTAFDGRQFRELLGGSWRNPGFAQTDEHPVVGVSWNDAVSFCKWLSAKEHRNYRLPTEAEWEYACRGGTRTAYFWGDNPDDGKGYANCGDQTAADRFPAWPRARLFSWRDGSIFTSPAGTYKPNALGLHDMIGNAAQWCSDYFAPYPAGDAVDPGGPVIAPKNAERVMRGGSWTVAPPYARSASRTSNAPGTPSTNELPGFRVCFDF